MSLLSPILNPIFGPLINWSPVLVIAIISLFVALIVTLIYKYATDQTVMKDLKLRQKKLQKELKENRKDLDKATKLQKEMMELNMQYMSHSMKSMLFTFVPVIIIFGWLQATLAFAPILPGQEFNVTVVFAEGYTGEVSVTVPEGMEVIGGDVKQIHPNTQDAFWGDKQISTAEFTFKGEEGNYRIVFENNGNAYDKEVQITTQQSYAKPEKTFPKKDVVLIRTEQEKFVPINLLGKKEGGWLSGRFGWLFTYIIFSMIFSMSLRKLMKVY